MLVGVARICSAGYKSRSRSGRYSPLAIGDLDSDIGQNLTPFRSQNLRTDFGRQYAIAENRAGQRALVIWADRLSGGR